jgi:peptidoglycan pentaglycine glycine transferase (the first glycine)
MKFIEDVNLEEYEQFVSTHTTKSHFMQSRHFGDVSVKKGFTPYYVVVKDNDLIVASAMILEKKKKGLTYLYIPRGYIMDYSNKDLLEFMTKSVVNFAKKRKAFFVKIDPDIKLHDLDQDGNILGNDNTSLVNTLIKLGYKHKGFNKNFEGNQPRYTFRLDLTKSMEEIRSNFHATTRGIIGKEIPSYINIFKSNDENDYSKFYALMQETAKRDEITLYSLDYYKNFHKILNKKDHSDLYILKVNIDELRKFYLNKLIFVDNEINKIENNPKRNIKKSENLINDLNSQKDKINNDMLELDNLDEKEYYLSSIITTKYNDKVWLIHGGNSNILRKLNANYFLHYKIIEDSKNEGYKKLDFFGATGDLTSKVSGIHLFKKRFGGEYTEFIGEFDLITNKLLYYLYTKIKRK